MNTLGKLALFQLAVERPTCRECDLQFQSCGKEEMR